MSTVISIMFKELDHYILQEEREGRCSWRMYRSSSSCTEKVFLMQNDKAIEEYIDQAPMCNKLLYTIPPVVFFFTTTVTVCSKNPEQWTGHYIATNYKQMTESIFKNA